MSIVPARIIENSNSSGEISQEYRGELDSKLQNKRKKVKTKGQSPVPIKKTPQFLEKSEVTIDQIVKMGSKETITVSELTQNTPDSALHRPDDRHDREVEKILIHDQGGPNNLFMNNKSSFRLAVQSPTSSPTTESRAETNLFHSIYK